MDNVVNWFILILVIVFDPLAVSLVIAANHLSSKEKQKQSLDELGEIGQDIGIGYEEPVQSFPSPVNGQITDSVTQSVNEPDVVIIPKVEKINARQIKSENRKKKSKRLKKSEEVGILNDSNDEVVVENKPEQNLFYQEGPRYNRGVSL
jgi:hypothetical protein